MRSESPAWLEIFSPLLGGEQPIYAQICDEIRQAILSSKLIPGTALPASRTLAKHLGISRTTVINAYDQLVSEGYLYSRAGSGTFVADILPHGYVHSGSRRTELSNSDTKPRANVGGSHARHRAHIVGIGASPTPFDYVPIVL
jgi:DNA-binding GntR family transcriptional regulator